MKRQTKIALISAVLPLSLATASFGQASFVNYTTGNYTQNFNGLGYSATNNAVFAGATPGTAVSYPTASSINGSFNLSDIVTNVTNSASSSLLTNSNSGSLAGWQATRVAGNGASGFLFRADDSNNASGQLFSVGNTNSTTGGITDRALGAVGSGSTVVRFGLVLQNNTASTTFNAFSLDFVTEIYRSSTATQNRLQFAFQVQDGAALPSDYNSSSAAGSTALAAAGTLFPSLDAVGLPFVTSNGPLDGSQAANRATVSGTVNSGFSWAPTKYLVLSWTDTNDTGSDANIAIDDLTFFAAVVVPAKILTYNNAAGNATWNSSSVNFLDTLASANSAFTNGDRVTFDGTAPGDVALVGTVSPGSVNVSAGSYRFTGSGNIGVSPTFTGFSIGNATVEFANTAANDFTLGISVTGGTLIYSNNNQLGVTTAPLVLSGGATARATGTITGGRNVTVSPNTSATYNTNGNNVSLGLLTVGAVNNISTFTKTGAGDLSISNAFFGFGSVFSIAAGSVTINNPGALTTISGGGFDFSNWVGDLIIPSNQRVDLAGSNGGLTYAQGGGKIIISGNGRGSANAAPNQTFGTYNVSSLAAGNGIVEIYNDIVVNPANNPFYRLNLGATGAGTFINTLNLRSSLAGNFDLSFSAGNFGGTGLVELFTTHSYTGSTFINVGGTGAVKLSVANALPPATALSFGDGFNNPNTGGNATNVGIGALDLNGKDLAIASLATTFATNATNPTLVAGIANSTNDLATLTISGSATTTYAGGIGTVATTLATPGSSQAISLVLAPANTGRLTLTAAAGTVNYSGVTTIGGGTLQIGGGTTNSTTGTLGDGAGAVSIASAGSLVLARSNAYSLTNPLSGTGRLINSGTGTSTVQGSLSNFTGTLGTTAGKLVIPGNTTGSYAVVADLDAVTVTGGTLEVPAFTGARPGVVVADAVTVSGTGFFDLQTNDLITGSSSLTNLRSAVAAWLGSVAPVGLGSTSANKVNTTIAVVSNNSLAGVPFYSTYDGVALTASDVIAKFTYVGDTNLDGVLDGVDLVNLIEGLSNGYTGWQNGDLNYDNVVNAADFNLFNVAFAAYTTPLSSGQGEAAGTGGTVPEPTALGLLLAALPLVTRRRR